MIRTIGRTLAALALAALALLGVGAAIPAHAVRTSAPTSAAPAPIAAIRSSAPTITWCATEDSAGPCVWDAQRQGNGHGRSYYVDAAQRVHYFDHGHGRPTPRKVHTRAVPLYAVWPDCEDDAAVRAAACVTYDEGQWLVVTDYHPYTAHRIAPPVHTPYGWRVTLHR